jgi:hypothetical protein
MKFLTNPNLHSKPNPRRKAIKKATNMSSSVNTKKMQIRNASGKIARVVIASERLDLTAFESALSEDGGCLYDGWDSWDTKPQQLLMSWGEVSKKYDLKAGQFFISAYLNFADDGNKCKWECVWKNRALPDSSLLNQPLVMANLLNTRAGLKPNMESLKIGSNELKYDNDDSTPARTNKFTMSGLMQTAGLDPKITVFNCSGRVAKILISSVELDLTAFEFALLTSGLSF